MSRYVLHYAPDNASLIIRLALEELAHPYDTVLVDRAAKGQRAAPYLALNPAGRIPTLETPEGPISETGAILLWLTDRHGRLAPSAGAPLRGAFLNWLFYVANTLHADAAQLFYVHRFGPEPAWPAMRAALSARIAGHFEVLEAQARPRLEGWFCGARPSALDLYVAALFRWVQLYPADLPERPLQRVDVSAFPQLHAMCAALEARPSTAALCVAEGMGPHPFTRPTPPNPPEGSAL